MGGDWAPVKCGRFKETAKRSDLAAYAGDGYRASHARYFWGLRVQLVGTAAGLPITFAVTNPEDDERGALLGMFQVVIT